MNIWGYTVFLTFSMKNVLFSQHNVRTTQNDNDNDNDNDTFLNSQNNWIHKYLRLLKQTTNDIQKITIPLKVILHNIFVKQCSK